MSCPHVGNIRNAVPSRQSQLPVRICLQSMMVSMSRKRNADGGCFWVDSLQHVRCRRAARRATQVDSVLQRRDGHHFRDGLLLVQHGPQRRSQPEPASGVARSLQIHLEQPMAADDIRHPLLEQTSWHSFSLRCLFSQTHLINPSISFSLSLKDLLAEKVRARKSRLDEYFPDFSRYVTPPDAAIEPGEDSEVNPPTYHKNL